MPIFDHDAAPSLVPRRAALWLSQQCQKQKLL